jgi:hypothetical protein
VWRTDVPIASESCAQSSHPQGPFHQYLPLLSAHRWLCAAEAYESEDNAAAAASSRRTFEQRMPAALASASTHPHGIFGTGGAGRCFVKR